MDDSAAHRLPVEIWADVAITLRDTYPCRHGIESIDGDPCMLGCDVKDYRSVRPLTQICRYLHNAIQPILFEYISLNFYDTKKVMSLASALASRPDLQLAVRGLRLESFESSAKTDAIFQVLPLLTEVRFFSIKSSTINPAIAQLLKNATHLRTLHMTYFTWEEDVPENWANHEEFGRNLKSIILNDLFATRPHHMPKCIQLLAPSLTTLDLTSIFIFEYMKTSPTLPFGSSLITLSTHIENGHQDAFIKFLSQCPNLEQLKALERYAT